ncbi:hydrogenase expression/formation protein HypD [Ruminiclostridium sufflavum DSM 19573]|uniref:Hydrogenase expression/formation protein HypD n=1 Tax=Ruminiclostridium sufflavum DSM 19573 TaxID=1121337 RepID=A0A318XNE0_9FIRM|nr:hydrogenase formation protein HypD [Ruminiclostridium sufflavum]PYG88421.1 hydrogenase expression/formation protein HypD [Ruminiclostridium sufflavum DSM 19573]
MADYIDEFRDKEVIKKIAEGISEYKGPDIKIMEVCGTHTMAISRYGLRTLLPDSIELLSGPGCPVCVTPTSYIDSALELADNKDIIITTFGDMMRIPGNDSTLLYKRAQGCNVQMVYSPLNAVDLARDNPDKEVVFLSVGFETTTPVIALSIYKAEREKIKNFSVLTANKTMPEAVKTLAGDGELAIDGFIYPGHVAAIIGTDFFSQVAYNMKKAGVVAGFEPLDILYSINVLVKNITEGNIILENMYSRIVTKEGNTKAQNKMYEVFEAADAVWRGIGMIQNSGLALRPEYERFDASKRFGIKLKNSPEPKGCLCGEVLRGKKKPPDCKLFKNGCTPENPVGACMVSSEGTCAAYYKYGG